MARFQWQSRETSARWLHSDEGPRVLAGCQSSDPHENTLLPKSHFWQSQPAFILSLNLPQSVLLFRFEKLSPPLPDLSFLFSPVSLFHHLSELRFPSLFFVSGIQSAEEDSADQSPVESIPIRGKKADRRSARSGVLLCLFCLSPHAVDNGGPFFSQLGGYWKDDQGESEVKVPPEEWNSSSNYRQRKQTRLFSSALGMGETEILRAHNAEV